jgi:hypothetical protein
MATYSGCIVASLTYLSSHVQFDNTPSFTFFTFAIRFSLHSLTHICSGYNAIIGIWDLRVLRLYFYRDYLVIVYKLALLELLGLSVRVLSGC